MRSYSIKMFNTFEIINEETNEPLIINWRTQKVKEVLVYLIHYAERRVSVEELANLFWKDLEFEAAKRQVYSTIYQIRLEMEKQRLPIVIMSQSGSYAIDLSKVRIDIEEFTNFFKQVDDITPNNEKEHKRILTLYKGDYLALEQYEWSYYQRVRYRVIWLQRKQALINYYIDEGRELDAVLALLEMQEIAPNYEWSYKKMIDLLYVIGDIDAVQKQKQGLRATRKENKRERTLA